VTHRRPDPESPEPAPRDDLEAVFDLLQGELGADEAAHLRDRVEREPALAEAHRSTERLLAAERRAFEPDAQREALEADASRLAAWIRSTAAASESAARDRWAGSPARQRGWARVLAFSVALHVLVLGVIAFLTRGTPRPDEERVAHVSLEAPEYREGEPDLTANELAFRYQGLALEDPSDMPDRLVLGEQETLADLLPETDVPLRARRPLDHPVGVVKPMTHRRLPALKRRRLNLLGFDANGTLNAVARGLRYLAGAQEKDGSMPAGGGRGRVEQTSLALLAFMADGHCSRDKRQSVNGRVVARGVRWLRGTLFPNGNGGRFDERTANELSLATVVLCEDYMLSYGWLSPATTQERANEIARLTSAVRAREPESAMAAVEGPWSVWALDAAARAGVIVPDLEDQQVFAAWVSDAVALETAPGVASPLSVLAVGTALLFEERGAEKPRFTAWGQAHGEALVARLDRSGKARTGDPVGDTALILLGLQVAYRTY
jgi:hypothetical protein